MTLQKPERKIWYWIWLAQCDTRLMNGPETRLSAVVGWQRRQGPWRPLIGAQVCCPLSSVDGPEEKINLLSCLSQTSKAPI